MQYEGLHRPESDPATTANCGIGKSMLCFDMTKTESRRLRTVAAMALGFALAAASIPGAAEEIDLEKLLSDDWSNAAADVDGDTDAEAEDQLSASYCDAYGPDYELVPGTTTCIRVGGHVQMDVYIRGRR